MSVDIKLPFGRFLYLALLDLRKKIAPAPLTEALWVEHAEEAYEVWHRARKAKRRAPFVPPTPQEVTAYSIEIGYPLDGVGWCLHYEKKDWCTSGTTKMRNWKSAVQHWKREGWKTSHRPDLPQTNVKAEPPGWLEFMRENYPEWVGLRDSTTWAGLTDGQKADVISVMRGKQP